MRKFLVAALVVLCVLAGTANAAGSVMPWLCLERCGGDATSIAANIAQLKAHSDIIDRVSYEWSDLGPNGTLIDNNFSDVSASINSFAKGYGMVTTVNLEWIRQVIYSRQLTEQFITAVTKAALAKGMAGVNFDWEPNDAGTTADAKQYALFYTWARAIAYKASGSNPNFTLSVDVGLWNTLWDWQALNAAMLANVSEGKAPAGEVVPMSTYTYDDDLFIPRLQLATQQISPKILRVGLMVWHARPQNMTASDVAYRFGALAYAKVCNIAIWVAPINASFWWDSLSEFKKRCG